MPRNPFKWLWWAFKVAYWGEKVGVTYEPDQSTITMKAVAESFKELLALYAAYSDVAEKFVKTLPFIPVNLSPDWFRIITSSLAVFISGHILLATKEGKFYAYGKLPRWIAGVLIWVVIFALAQSIYSLATAPRPYIGTADSSFPVPGKSWQLTGVSSNPDVLTYTAKMNIPAEPAYQYKDIGVRILPTDGFKLVSVDPTHHKSVSTEQEATEDGDFSEMQSQWHFEDFNKEGDWEFTVKVSKPGSAQNVPSQPPIETTILLYKD